MKQESFRMEVLMKNLQAQCMNTCVSDSSLSRGGQELTISEVNCIDKCAWKYLFADRILTNAMDRGAQQVTAAAGDNKKKR